MNGIKKHILSILLIPSEKSPHLKTADDGAQSNSSRGCVHVCPARAYVLFGSREPLGFGLENPQGFGVINADTLAPDAVFFREEQT